MKISTSGGIWASASTQKLLLECLSIVKHHKSHRCLIIPFHTLSRLQW